MPADKPNYAIETSITLDYRRGAWGIERIVLDAVANHLPEDCGGNFMSVRFKQGDKSPDFRAIDHAKKIEQIIIRDNGTGYDAELLSLLYSTKHAPLAVGRFGEGMKMVAAAALREGLNIEYRSKGWSAFPYTKPEFINGVEVRRLCFIVNRAEPIVGSRTIFHNPSEALIQEILSLPKKALRFNSTYRVLSAEQDAPDTKYPSRIIGDGDIARLFVKGFRFAEIPAIFSYDLGLEDISPDRKITDINATLDEIERLLRACTERKVIEAVLRAADKDSVSYNKARYEFMAFDASRHSSKRCLESYFQDKTSQNQRKSSLELEAEAAWMDVFKKVFGEKAVIADEWNTAQNADAGIYGFRPVRLNAAVAKFMSNCGIKQAASVVDLQERLYKWVKKEEMTAEEQELLALIPRVYKWVTGASEPIEIRLYSGIFLPDGTPVQGQAATSGVEDNGTKHIDMHRELLKDRRMFLQTCVHEAGHLASDKPDYDRDFTEYFVLRLVDEFEKENPGSS